MKLTKTNSDKLTIELTMVIAPEDYAEASRKRLAECRRNADFKGFRKGNVPASLVKRVYGPQILADAVNAPVSVMATAGEGGAWGIALLASYLVNKEEGETLEAFLDNKVFADQESSTLDPKPEGVAGFNAFMDSYMKGLSIEKAAVDSKIW